MNHRIAVRVFVALAFLFLLFGVHTPAEAGGRCHQNQSDTLCQTPTDKPTEVSTEEPQPSETAEPTHEPPVETPTPTPEDTATSTPETPAPTEDPTESPTPTETETPGDTPETPTPTTDTPSPSCQVQLVQALDNGWVEISIGYNDGPDETSWWYFDTSGASHPWTDEWFGISGLTGVYGDMFTPGESFTVNVYLNDAGPVCSLGVAVPAPVPEPTETPEPTPTEPPVISPLCSIELSITNLDAFEVAASGSYQGAFDWGAGITDWGHSGESNQPFNFPGFFGEFSEVAHIFPGYGSYTVTMTVNGPGGSYVCSGGVTFEEIPPEEPLPPSDPEPEETQVPKPARQKNISPNGLMRVESRGGELWILDGAGNEYPIGVEGRNPFWLPDWTILAQAENGELILTDRLATFVRYLGVSGTIKAVSLDGQWVVYQNGGETLVVSIHGISFGQGVAGQGIFAQLTLGP